jgi:hypothetical protein
MTPKSIFSHLTFAEKVDKEMMGKGLIGGRFPTFGGPTVYRMSQIP